MTYFIRKINVAIHLLLMTSIGYAYGDYNNSLSSCDDSVDCCPCQPSGCGHGFISADLLYWRAFESGLDTCFPSEVFDSVSSDGTVISRFSGKGRDPHFEWNPGFRIGAGYEFACSNLGIAAFWTHFDSHAHGSGHHGSGHHSSGSYGSGNYGSGNHGNRLKWNINYDVIDVLAAYRFDLGSCFVLRPFGGLRGARIDQKLHQGGSCSSNCSSRSSSSDYSCSEYYNEHYSAYSDFYTDFYSGSNNFSSDFSSSFCINDDPICFSSHKKSNFWGVGPLLGLEADWNIGCGFSIYASASVSWLYGRFDIRETESEQFVDACSYCKITKDVDADIAAADAAIGIRWENCICGDKRLILQFGLEHHRYFDYNRFGNYGDLIFDGVNFSVAVAY